MSNSSGIKTAIIILLILAIGIVIAFAATLQFGSSFTENNPLPTLASTVSLAQFEAELPTKAPTIPATNTPEAIAAVATNTATATDSPTATDIATVTHTAVPTSTPSPTTTPSNTPTNTPLPSATNTATAVPPSPTPQPPTLIPTAIPPTAALPTETPEPPTAVPEPTNTVPPPLTNGYPELTLVPGQPTGYLNKYPLVAYYGSPMGVGLGILGNQSRYDTLQLLRGTVAQWQPYYDQTILPAYHMVTTVANSSPPEYRHHVPLAVIEEWVASAKENGVAIILDIQPGRVDLLSEYYRIRYLLYEPHVHLAIDPEFVMAEGQVPLVHVGQLYASQINPIQADMNSIGFEIGLNRVLILHQFKDSMLPDKELIESMPFVELMIDGDGVGPSGPKIANYNQYANEPAFEYGGFKLFPWDGDNPIMTPDWVTAVLFPKPVLIIYQ